MKPNHKCGSFDADNLLYLSGNLGEDELAQQIRRLKRQLRGVMNGVASSSMQERGLNYKVNYGVPFVILKQMAKTIPQNHDLAQLMWVENVRELNILATFVQPIETFSEQLAEEWIKRIKNIEQAEQLSMNLLQKTSFGASLSLRILKNVGEEMTRITAWLLMARVARTTDLNNLEAELVIEQAMSDLKKDLYQLSTSVILALKKVGSKNSKLADEILKRVSDISLSNEISKTQLIEDLSFEFDYYNKSTL